MLLFSRFHAMNLRLYGVFPSYFRGQKGVSCRLFYQSP